MNEPIVSIIVTAFRRLDYLGEALASAISQTFPNFEIIVSDDGSSADIAAFVTSLHDPRIRYRTNSRTLGIAMNHRAAFAEAGGRYLANLDDDDRWEPEFLTSLVPPLEADPSLTVAFCDHYLVDSQGEILLKKTDENSRFYGRDRLAPGRHQPFREMAVVRESIPLAMAAVFRRSILEKGGLPARTGGSYDHWLAYLASQGDGAAFYVPRRLTRYRVHMQSGTLTRNRRNLRNCIYVRSRFLEDPELKPYRATLTNSLGICYGKLSLCEIDIGAFRKAWLLARRGWNLMNRSKNRLALIKNGMSHIWTARLKKPS